MSRALEGVRVLDLADRSGALAGRIAIIDNGRIVHVFYPVFPPDRNAADVLAWLRDNPAV